MRSKSLILIILTGILIFFQPSTEAMAFIIDDFNNGDFRISAQGAGPTIDSITQTGLPLNSTIGGTRTTIVRKGWDYNPAIAELNNGMIELTLDNDDCTSWLSYSDFGQIGFQDELGIEFDVLYANSGSLGTGMVTLSLIDIFGKSVSRSIEFGQWINGRAIGTSGDYIIDFDSNLRDMVDLTMIAEIDLRFVGGVDWQAFSLDSIRTVSAPVPEPSSILIFGTGVFSLLGMVRIKKYKA